MEVSKGVWGEGYGILRMTKIDVLPKHVLLTSQWPVLQ